MLLVHKSIVKGNYGSRRPFKAMNLKDGAEICFQLSKDFVTIYVQHEMDYYIV